MMAQSWSLSATYTRLVLYFAEYYEQFHNVVAEPVFQTLKAAPVTKKKTEHSPHGVYNKWFCIFVIKNAIIIERFLMAQWL